MPKTATTLRRLFEQHQFRSVLDCAGNCALQACELDAELAWRINVDGVQNLLDVIEAVRGGTSSCRPAPPCGSCISRSIWSSPATATAGTSKPIRPIR